MTAIPGNDVTGDKGRSPVISAIKNKDDIDGKLPQRIAAVLRPSKQMAPSPDPSGCSAIPGTKEMVCWASTLHLLGQAGVTLASPRIPWNTLEHLHH